MKKVLLVILFLIPVIAWAEKPNVNPADYTISVHVQSSKLEPDCSDVTGGSSICVWTQRLNVLIDGKKYELLGGPKRPELLHIGDYKAKIHKEDTTKPFEYSRSYDFLFSDGSTGTYSVVGESE